MVMGGHAHRKEKSSHKTIQMDINDLEFAKSTIGLIDQFLEKIETKKRKRKDEVLCHLCDGSEKVMICENCKRISCMQCAQCSDEDSPINLACVQAIGMELIDGVYYSVFKCGYCCIFNPEEEDIWTEKAKLDKCLGIREQKSLDMVRINQLIYKLREDRMKRPFMNQILVEKKNVCTDEDLARLYPSLNKKTN